MIPFATKDYPSEAQQERALDIACSLGDFDVCCLQECFGGFMSDYREKFKAYALKAGLYYQVFDQTPDFVSTYFCDGGTTILSRYPILASAC